MPGAFQYKPKFVDIRVRPPSANDASEQDVHALKPGERACDHPGCLRVATARAPKARDMLHEHYWFCQPHAAEYNRNWNFFAGLPEAEVRRRQQEEMMTGGRPTWDMKAGKMSRKPEPEGRKLGKIERNALADLDLDEDADASKIRARYTELVRRLHPDANNGDRSGEHRLQRVIRSYQSLRKAGMV